MKRQLLQILVIVALLAAACGGASVVNLDFSADDTASDADIADQRAALLAAFESSEFGPQSPRDINSTEGTNPVTFPEAPPSSEMNLCNIHFHEAAEHRGGEFTTYTGNGDGEGNGTGYAYDGELTDDELAEYENQVGLHEGQFLQPGETIEIHYVHSTDPIEPGPTLGACLASADSTPSLRVEAQVFVLVNDDSAADLVELTEVAEVDGFWQAPNIPVAGTPVSYAGSTTGPSFNQEGSPFLVTWNVRPEVIKVDIASVEAWFEDNVFDEDYAHAVRNLVTNPVLLSPIN